MTSKDSFGKIRVGVCIEFITELRDLAAKCLVQIRNEIDFPIDVPKLEIALRESNERAAKTFPKFFKNDCFVWIFLSINGNRTRCIQRGARSGY